MKLKKILENVGTRFGTKQLYWHKLSPTGHPPYITNVKPRLKKLPICLTYMSSPIEGFGSCNGFLYF